MIVSLRPHLVQPLLDPDELDDLVLPDPVHHLQLRDILLPLRLSQPVAHTFIAHAEKS